MGNNIVKGKVHILIDKDNLMIGENVTGLCLYEAIDPNICVYIRVCGRETF